MKRKYYTRKQISAINWKRRWKKLWDEDPDVMEGHRVNATKAAALMRHEQKLGLSDLLASWPQLMDAQSLERQVKEVIPKNYKPASLVRRLKRLGLIRYRDDVKQWHNLCHLPAV